jgi:hypothetical protein
MLVGVDFDNTIVCYDRLFHTLAVERNLIPPETPVNKTAVRDYLRSVGREGEWTKLQGVAYGPEIQRAEPFPGVLDFFRECKRRGIPTVIVSHKTKYPYRGRRYNLHKAARGFLKAHGFLDTSVTGLTDDRVFLELSKEAKLERIAAAGCTHFIDDLPEFLSETTFPTAARRILFDPEHRYPPNERWTPVAAWSEVPAVVDGVEENRSTTETISTPVGTSPPLPDDAAVRALLTQAGSPGDDARLEPVAGSGNNRGFRVTASDGRRFFLKWYFRHPDDRRDRLGTETAFIAFCRRHGVDDVPQLLARDEAAGLALYEFVDGRRLKPEEIDEAAVAAALEFYRRVNAHREADDAESLPIASEACFSLQEHIERIGGRVQKLVEAASASGADRALRHFVRERLAPAWSEVYERLDRLYPIEGVGRQSQLSEDDRRLSPSDFGFHNALRGADGRIRFIDLEYAGWDGPTKLVCDFFCQVQVPVPRKFWSPFVETVAAELSWPAEFMRRASALLPAYRVKWCCIALNVFLPTGSARRAFGTAAPPTPERLATQLQIAERVLAELAVDLQAVK